MTPRDFIRADSHVIAPVFEPEKVILAGLDRPLVRSRPGEDQPPPGIGDGLRLSDIGVPMRLRLARRSEGRQRYVESTGVSQPGARPEIRLGQALAGVERGRAV